MESTDHHVCGSERPRASATTSQTGGPEGEVRHEERADPAQDCADESIAESTATATEFDTSSTCIECGADSFARGDAGEWFCEVCGAVHTAAELEFTEPGWKPQDQRRVGPASSVTRVSVGTCIGTHDGSSERWTQYNKRLSAERQTLHRGLKEVRALAAALETPGTATERAAYLFRRAADDGLLVGRSIEAVAAGALHAAARENETPVPLGIIEDATTANRNSIMSSFSTLIQAFNLRVKPPRPATFVGRIATAASLPDVTLKHGRTIVREFEDAGHHVGQSPPGVAAACLYAAAREQDTGVTQEQLAAAASVSTVTVSRQWQQVSDFLNE